MRVVVDYRPLATLRLNPRNARIHSKRQIQQIAKSINQFGFVNPILVDRDGTIIAGEGRYLAAVKLSLADAPVIVLGDLNDAQCRALALVDNKLALNSAWDEDILKAEIRALKSLSDVATDEPTVAIAVDDLGFSEGELERMLAEDIKPKPKPEPEPQERFWISIRGPAKDEDAAMALLKQLMKELTDVVIEVVI